jgi:hypothetical protein
MSKQEKAPDRVVLEYQGVVKAQSGGGLLMICVDEDHLPFAIKIQANHITDLFRDIQSHLTKREGDTK